MHRIFSTQHAGVTNFGMIVQLLFHDSRNQTILVLIILVNGLFTDAQLGSLTTAQVSSLKTDAIATLLKEEPVFAYEYDGVRYDCGSKLGYMKASVEFALRHSELGSEFAAYLKSRSLT